MTKEALNALGTKANATAETSLSAAMAAMHTLSGVFVEAYAIGAVSGSQALQARNQAIMLAGKIAEIHSDVLTLHQQATEMARGAGIDPGQPYADLPATRDGIKPLGGGR